MYALYLVVKNPWRNTETIHYMLHDKMCFGSQNAAVVGNKMHVVIKMEFQKCARRHHTTSRFKTFAFEEYRDEANDWR